MRDEPSTPTTAPWVVADARHGVMHCRHCGEKQPLAMLEGQRLDFAAAIMKGFVDCHRDCQEQTL